MSERLFGRRLSSGKVSEANKKLLEPVERWRNRSLAGEKSRKAGTLLST